MDKIIDIFKKIKKVISPKEKKIFVPPIDARKIIWTIVPHFIYNTKENRLITQFNDPLWLDDKNNIMNQVNTYHIQNEEIKQNLIKKINRSSFTIVYEFGEKEWKILSLEDFNNHPRHNTEKTRLIFNRFL